MAEQTVTLVVSTGDCNGIGPEVFAGALRQLRTDGSDRYLRFRLAANPGVLEEHYRRLGVPCRAGESTIEIAGTVCELLPCKSSADIAFGRTARDAGALAWESLETAVAETLAGRADALLTLPVSKAALKQAGYPFPGQTEFLAERCAVARPMMILCTTTVRVGLVTIHIPLADVPGRITRERILERLQTLHASLAGDFGCTEPRIAVLGLNPHAGEDGEIGREELDVIAPAVRDAVEQGIAAEGPFPADGFFAHGAWRRYDGILAMYHDQGLIPLKMLASGGGVNVTAGLPIVRTSPDHGTAFAIAGRGTADPSSTVEAIQAAVHIRMVRRRS